MVNGWIAAAGNAEAVGDELREGERRVLGEADRFVATLQREDFRVEEDGVRRTITHFAKEESPVSYALVVDNSGSLRNMLNNMLRAGGVLISANKPGDETMLVRFVSSDEIRVQIYAGYRGTPLAEVA